MKRESNEYFASDVGSIGEGEGRMAEGIGRISVTKGMAKNTRV